MIKLGDVIEVLAYLERPDVLLIAPPIRAPWVDEIVKAGRLAHGIHVTLADGRMLPFERRQ
jgi:hypothetical protein